MNCIATLAHHIPATQPEISLNLPVDDAVRILYTCSFSCVRINIHILILSYITTWVCRKTAAHMMMYTLFDCHRYHRLFALSVSLRIISEFVSYMTVSYITVSYITVYKTNIGNGHKIPYTVGIYKYSDTCFMLLMHVFLFI